MSTYGFVYIMANSSMPGVLKIGMTERSPMQRCVELSRATGVPTPFELLCYGEVAEPRAAEQEIHEILSEFRLSQSREFFRVDFERAQAMVSENTTHFAMTHEGNNALFRQIGIRTQAIPLVRLVDGHPVTRSAP